MIRCNLQGVGRLGLQRAARCFGLLLCIAAGAVHAEPYIAVEQGLKCTQCHVNPTGGGLRTKFGDIFAQDLMPVRHLDTGADTWVGELSRFLSIGGDLRYDATVTQVRHSDTVQQFALNQSRIYLDANVIPDRLLIYADEQIAPGGAINREAYGLFWSAAHDWYVKAGQMYLPFGLRLQDQSAFIVTTSGINMTTPDQGVEFGWLRGAWDAQLTVSNGTAGGPVVGAGKQKQYGSQLSYVQPVWRLGIAANDNDAAGGSKSSFAVFGGLKTGPVAWLAQAELTDDRSIANGQGKMLATLLEANWLIARGQNLKITDEFLDPNRRVAHDAVTRWSLVYELTPIQFIQLRGGVRYLHGIPQDDSEHQRLYFVELHGFF